MQSSAKDDLAFEMPLERRQNLTKGIGFDAAALRPAEMSEENDPAALAGDFLDRGQNALEFGWRP